MATILNYVASHLDGLTATNAICVALGETMSFGSNLYIGYEPDLSATSITLIPSGISPPDLDNYKYEAYFAIKLKAINTQKAIDVQQKFINYLHMKEISTIGKIRALQSLPTLGAPTEGGEWKTSITNYNIKYIKV